MAYNNVKLQPLNEVLFSRWIRPLWMGINQVWSEEWVRSFNCLVQEPFFYLKAQPSERKGTANTHTINLSPPRPPIYIYTMTTLPWPLHHDHFIKTTSSRPLYHEQSTTTTPPRPLYHGPPTTSLPQPHYRNHSTTIRPLYHDHSTTTIELRPLHNHTSTWWILSRNSANCRFFVIQMFPDASLCHKMTQSQSSYRLAGAW